MTELNERKESSCERPLWSREFILLLSGNLFIYQGILMFIPTFPVYIKQLGGNELQASLPFAVISLSALLLRPLSGSAADLWGRRPLLLLGLGILLLFNCSLFYISTIALILCVRFLQGIGWGMTSTVLATIMSDLVPPKRRGEGTGYFALSIIVATSLATIGGIEIMKRGDFSVVLTISTALLTLGLFLAGGLGAKQKQATQVKPKIVWNDLFERKALLPALLCFLHSIPLSGIMSFIMLYGKEIGVENTALYFVGHVAMILLSRPFAGKLYDRKGHVYVIVPGVIFMAAGLLLLSCAETEMSLLLASLFYGLGYGAAHPALQAWAVERSPVLRKGAANGTFLSAIDLGYAFGAVALGAIATHGGYALMYRSSIIFLLFFAVVYFRALREKKATKSYSEQVG